MLEVSAFLAKKRWRRLITAENISVYFNESGAIIRYLWKIHKVFFKRILTDLPTPLLFGRALGGNITLFCNLRSATLSASLR